MRRALPVLAIGFFLSWWRARSLLDPFFLLPFGTLSALLAAHAILDGKTIRAAVLESCGTITAIVLSALVPVNWRFPPDEWLLPGPSLTFATLTLSLAAAAFSAVLANQLAVRFPPARLRLGLRATMALILIGLTQLPGRWIASAINAVLDWGVTPTALSLSVTLAIAAYAIQSRRKMVPEIKVQS